MFLLVQLPLASPDLPSVGSLPVIHTAPVAPNFPSPLCRILPLSPPDRGLPRTCVLLASFLDFFPSCAGMFNSLQNVKAGPSWLARTPARIYRKRRQNKHPLCSCVFSRLTDSLRCPCWRHKPGGDASVRNDGARVREGAWGTGPSLSFSVLPPLQVQQLTAALVLSNFFPVPILQKFLHLF